MGWREWLALPGLGVTRIKAKVDTGARTSALHAFDIERFEHRGTPMVRFTVHPLQKDSHHSVACEAELLDERWVKSSSGKAQLRPVILCEVELDDLVWPIELTLTARDAMGFRMLLGRQAVRGRFVVDPGRSYVLSRRLRPKKRKR